MEQVLMCSGDVTRGHDISLSNQAEPAQPISVRIASSRISHEYTSSVVSEHSSEQQRCPAVG